MISRLVRLEPVTGIANGLNMSLDCVVRARSWRGGESSASLCFYLALAASLWRFGHRHSPQYGPLRHRVGESSGRLIEVNAQSILGPAGLNVARSRALHRRLPKRLIRRPSPVQRFFRIAVYRLKIGSDILTRSRRTGSAEILLAILTDRAFHHQARRPNSDAARSGDGQKRRVGSRCEGHFEHCESCAAHDDCG